MPSAIRLPINLCFVVDGTKCPKYHVDNVQCRMIMPILGPGTTYVPENVAENDDERLPRVINRHWIRHITGHDTLKANDMIVQPHAVREAKNKGIDAVQQGRTGEAVFLMGKLWEDRVHGGDCKDCGGCHGDDNSVDESNKLFACVHKSPVIAAGQERILLVVDIANDMN